MTRDDMIRMAQECQLIGMRPHLDGIYQESLESFFNAAYAAGAAAEQKKLAAWMMAQGYATGHGDTTEDLLRELEWQIDERIVAERELCAKFIEAYPEWIGNKAKQEIAAAIRARSNNA